MSKLIFILFLLSSNEKFATSVAASASCRVEVGRARVSCRPVEAKRDGDRTRKSLRALESSLSSHRRCRRQNHYVKSCREGWHWSLLPMRIPAAKTFRTNRTAETAVQPSCPSLAMAIPTYIGFKQCRLSGARVCGANTRTHAQLHVLAVLQPC